MFCPNCGTKLPDNASFCGNCGARVGEMPIIPTPAKGKSHKLSTGWITLISLVCVLALFCAIFLPIYFTAPVLPAASATSDGKSSFSYEFDKKTGVLKINGEEKGVYDENTYYTLSPYYDNQWLIALSNVNSNYDTQSLQFCLASEEYVFDTVTEYVLANNPYISNGKIKEVDLSTTIVSKNYPEEVNHVKYDFETVNNRVVKITEHSTSTNQYSEDTETIYSISYDNEGKITKITYDDAGGTFKYDREGHFVSYSYLDNYSNDTPPYSSEIKNNHMTRFDCNWGALSSSYSTYIFSGNQLKGAVIVISGGDAAGSSSSTMSSQISYKSKHVSQLATTIKYDGSYVEDVESGRVKEDHHKTNTGLSFQYKRIL